MKRKSISSSHLKSIGYNTSTKILEIEFQNGDIYQYFDVPSKCYLELLGASSAGKYFNENIKGLYDFKHINLKKERTKMPQITNTESQLTNKVIRLKPQQFIHILDNNIGVTRLEIGPQTITLQEHERLVLDAKQMLIIPPRHYCVITNPIIRDEQGNPLADKYGQIKLHYGDMEIRFEQEPFPLYPGEKLIGSVNRLRVVETNTALKLQAIRDFEETIEEANKKKKVIKRLAGTEWLFEGPGTYIPRVEIKVIETMVATIIKPNQALHLTAKEACIDRQGKKRKAGEEWLVREEGAYLPGIYEEVVDIINAYILTEKTALHLGAKRTFKDILGKERKAGDEWLVTITDAETHIPDVYEEVIGEVEITTLNDREWCIVFNPIDANGKAQLGKREIRKGRVSFFLHPDEELEEGIQDVYILEEQEALLLKATEAFEEGEKDKIIKHNPGDLWMIEGPTDYIPSIYLEVLERRKAISLDKNEGIYIRNIKTGEIILIRGPQTYMLTPYEELWEKELPRIVEELLARKSDLVSDRGDYNDPDNGLREEYGDYDDLKKGMRSLKKK